VYAAQALSGYRIRVLMFYSLLGRTRSGEEKNNEQEDIGECEESHSEIRSMGLNHIIGEMTI
jgi:hypothetical protein